VPGGGPRIKKTVVLPRKAVISSQILMVEDEDKTMLSHSRSDGEFPLPHPIRM
jgi:hypothetical protein